MNVSRMVVKQVVARVHARPGPRAHAGSRTALRALAALLVGWLVWHSAAGAITPRSGLGYAMGVVGGSMMVVLMLYPLRKHLAPLRRWLPLRYWLSLHVLCGIAGPLLLVLHSGFGMRSINATVAMVTMLLVVASGIVGRYLYRRVHSGAEAAHAAAASKREILGLELGRHGAAFDPVRVEVDRFAALALMSPAMWREQADHFLRVEIGRQLARYRIWRAVAGALAVSSSPGRLAALQRAAFEAIAATQNAAQFAAYERLFSLWRIVHVPVVAVMFVSAVVHVVAAHAY